METSRTMTVRSTQEFDDGRSLTLTQSFTPIISTQQSPV